MADGFGLNNQEVFNKGSIATFNLMLHILEQFLQVGKICILEANFKKYEIEDIQKLLTKYNSTCLTYLFRADFEIIFRRYIERDKQGKRHWVHKIGGESNIEDFENGHRKTGMGEIGIGKIIEVDTTNFEKVDYDKLLMDVKKYLDE